ncbi:MAG: hypothetical protein ACXWJK_17470, partial [Burkholderiaceae bacterium]
MLTKQKKIDFSASLSASPSASALITRRTFLMATGATAVGLAATGSRVFAAEPTAATVTIVPFSDAGQRQTAVRVPKVVKTKAEWRKQLSAESFEVTREEGTERP